MDKTVPSGSLTNKFSYDLPLRLTVTIELILSYFSWNQFYATEFWNNYKAKLFQWDFKTETEKDVETISFFMEQGPDLYIKSL